MYAVLYLNNSWEWSGGYSKYLNWTGHGKEPIPGIDGWDAFNKYVAQYAECEECHSLFLNHIRTVVSRTNRYTNKNILMILPLWLGKLEMNHVLLVVREKLLLLNG